MLKHCQICSKEKEISEFRCYKKSDHSIYIYPKCKECESIRYKELYTLDRKNKLYEQEKIRKQNPQYLQNKNKNALLNFHKHKHNKPINERIWLNVKSRAKKHNIEFNLIPEDITVPEYCPVFPHIKLCITNDVVSDNSPSCDRIDNNLGYYKENIVIISNKANRMKNSGTLQEIQMLAEFYKKLDGAPCGT